MKTFIYALMDPRDGAVKYIGKTINLKSRMQSHQNGIGKFRLGAWLSGLKRKGLYCRYVVLEEYEGEGWELRERYWIGYYRDLGADICNLSNGGEGQVGRKLSAESCQKLRDAFKGRPIPQEMRECISKSLTGKVQSPETVAKRLATINERRAEAGLELHKSWASYEDYRAAGHIAYNITRARQRRERGQLVKGSEEWKRNAAEQIRAYHASLTDEQKKARNARLCGRTSPNKGKKLGPLSPEHRAKLSAIHKQRLASLTPEQREARMAPARKAQPAAWRALIDSKTKEERRALMAAADAANPMKQAVRRSG